MGDTQNRQDFVDLQQISEKYFKRDVKRPRQLKTGFPALDEALGGGLAPGRLVVLGGTPAVGKSTLAIQIAAHMAENGYPVLYFSMEMPEDQIAAKVINRKLFLEGRSVPLDTLLYGEPKEDQWEAVDAVKERLSKELRICTRSVTADEIKWNAREWADELETSPLVVIDYLQILRPEKGAHSDKQIVDANLRCLMELAQNIQDDYDHGNDDWAQDQPMDTGGFPVLLISSLNRSGYNGPVQISFFKETGDIEYCADILLGLQFQACRDVKNFDLEEEKSKNPRMVELAVLKNRYGRSGQTIPLQYDTDHDCFWEGDEAAPPAPMAPGSSPADGNAPESVSKASPAASAASGILEEPHGVKKRPRTFYCVMNNTKVANEIRAGAYGEHVCRVSEKGAAEKVSVSYGLSAPLSSMDCCVADAVYTLIQAKKKVSLRSILQILMGYKQVNLTEQMREELKDSLDHLREVQLKLDCTEHLRAMQSKLERTQGPQELSYDGPFLRLGGPDDRGLCHPVSGVDDKEVLPLHTYAEAVRQLISVSSVLLDVTYPDKRRMSGTKDDICLKRRLSNTKDNICLKWFLAHRLEVIRYDDPTSEQSKQARKWMRTISFRENGDIRAKICRPDPPGGTAEKRLDRIHAAVKLTLDYYQEIGYIKGFQELEKKGSPSSFQIVGEISDPDTL